MRDGLFAAKQSLNQQGDCFPAYYAGQAGWNPERTSGQVYIQPLQ
jgi:hypothetical protein